VATQALQRYRFISGCVNIASMKPLSVPVFLLHRLQHAPREDFARRTEEWKGKGLKGVQPSAFPLPPSSVASSALRAKPAAVLGNGCVTESHTPHSPDSLIFFAKRRIILRKQRLKNRGPAGWPGQLVCPGARARHRERTGGHRNRTSPANLLFAWNVSTRTRTNELSGPPEIPPSAGAHHFFRMSSASL